MDCHEIWFRHLWSPQAELKSLCWPLNFSSSTIMLFRFLIVWPWFGPGLKPGSTTITSKSIFLITSFTDCQPNLKLESIEFLPPNHCVFHVTVSSSLIHCQDREECWHNCLHLPVLNSQMEKILSWAYQHMFSGVSSLTCCGKVTAWKCALRVTAAQPFRINCVDWACVQLEKDFCTFCFWMDLNGKALCMIMELGLFVSPLQLANSNILPILLTRYWRLTCET